MYSSVRNALIAKLTGDAQGNIAKVLDPNGLRVATPDVYVGSTFAGQSIGNLSLPELPWASGLVVPVFPYSLDGTDFSTWPAVEVVKIRHRFRQANYIYNDPIQRNVPGTRRRIVFDDGETSEGHTLVTRRAHPEPMDVVFRIRVWTRSDDQLGYLVDRIYEILGFKSYLEVTLRDGTTEQYDTFVLEEGADLEAPRAVLQAPDLREYSQVILYQVEAYRDNTLAVTSHKTITSRTIEVSGPGAEDAGTVLEPDDGLLTDIE